MEPEGVGPEEEGMEPDGEEVWPPVGGMAREVSRQRS